MWTRRTSSHFLKSLSVLLELPLPASKRGALKIRLRTRRPVPGGDPPLDPPPDPPPSGTVLTTHPRTLITGARVIALRQQLLDDSVFRARWQDAVTSFEAADGYWGKGGNEAFTISFAAFLTCVRRPSGANADLGLTWGSSWQIYFDRIMAAVQTWGHDAKSGLKAASHGIVYDMLYNDMSGAQRTELNTWIVDMLDVVTPLKWQAQGGHWDDQTSDEHWARVILSMAANDAQTRFAKAIQESLDWAEAHEGLQYGEGNGYAWKDETIQNIGPVFCLYMLKNAATLTAAETIDKCLISLTNMWMHVRQFIIPHPGYAGVTFWKQARVAFAAPFPPAQRNAGVAANMLWGRFLLPGKVNLNPGSDHTHTTLATSESAYWSYWAHVFTLVSPGTTSDRKFSEVTKAFKWVKAISPAAAKGHMQLFFGFIPWLIENVQIPATVLGPEAAGIPRVRRWWPGALNWVTIIGGTWESGSDQSLIVYSHRRWNNNAYTAGTKQNGMWQVHRGGPLLIKRGATSHGPVGKTTWGGNGTVCFVDQQAAEFATVSESTDEDRGDIRRGDSNQDTYRGMLADPGADFGQITNWFSDTKVVAITSDLTKCYNNTVHFTNATAASVKIGGTAKTFTREFVCVQRGGDGTDHERIFTYDRILTVQGNGRYQPRYNLCPATNPDINGTETPYTPWFPDPSGESNSEPELGRWKTTGPVRWDYDNATRLIYDSSTQAAPLNGGSGPGTGKVCVTWLQPSGAGVRVRKRGGTAMYWDPPEPGNIDGCPAFGSTGTLFGKDGAWGDANSPSEWMFAGLYTVQVFHTAFNPDTRFLMACDVMLSSQTPDTAAQLTSDVNSVGARCGASAVLFAKDATGRTIGSVTIPSGVVYLVIANLPASTVRNLVAGSGLSITTSNRTPSSSGVLTVGLSGAGTLTFT